MFSFSILLCSYLGNIVGVLAPDPRHLFVYDIKWGFLGFARKDGFVFPIDEAVNMP